MRVRRKVRWWLASSDQDGVPEHEARIRVFGWLVWYAEMMRYKSGWAGCKFKAIYGCWPNGERSAAIEPTPMQGELAWWINQQNAAFSTARRRERIRAGNESGSL